MAKCMTHPMTRRRMLRQLVVTAGAIGCLPFAAHTASAAGKKEKSVMQYQDHPRGKSACENCGYFIPSDDSNAPGHCTVVAGDISPHGWCLAYTSAN